MIDAYVITKPVITEKTLKLASENNIYTFQVALSTSKPQIASVIEHIYNVKVVRVRTIINQARAKKTGRKRLVKSGTKLKKALITLKAGDVIDIFDIKK